MKLKQFKEKFEGFYGYLIQQRTDLQVAVMGRLRRFAKELKEDLEKIK